MNYSRNPQSTAVDRFIAKYGPESGGAPRVASSIPAPPVQGSVGWLIVLFLIVAALIAVGVFVYMRQSGSMDMPPWADDFGSEGWNEKAMPERWRPFDQMDSRWDEALDAVETIRTLLAVHTAMHGAANGLQSGAVVDCEQLMRHVDDPTLFDRLRYFDRQDFVLEVTSDEPFRWELSVRSSSVDGPGGVYRVDSAGVESFENNR